MLLSVIRGGQVDADNSPSLVLSKTCKTFFRTLEPKFVIHVKGGKVDAGNSFALLLLSLLAVGVGAMDCSR